MFGKWERTLKIRAAKSIISNLVDSLRVNEDLELGLRVYGHQYPIEDRNCEDSDLVVPFSVNNHDDIIENIRELEPKGTTPIAYSLQEAASDFPESSEYRNIVIIITDGIESCGGDPCNVSLALQKSGVFLRPFIIGLNISDIEDNEFECIGNYHDATEINNFRSVLNDALNQSLGRTTVTVELQDENGQNSESNINVSFINNFTNESVYEFVHYRDPNGRTDTLTIDPVLDYDIVVNTIPPVIKKDVTLVAGTHNQIDIKAPQGSLRFNMKNSSTYKNGVKAILRKSGGSSVIHIQDVNEVEKYLSGSYDLEITTLPKTFIKNLNIDQGRTKTVNIDEPGLVNLSSTAQIYGSVYQVNTTRETWVINLDTNARITTLALQPGQYKVAFRTKDTFGSKYTAVRHFSINAGKSTTINLNNKI